MFRRYGLITILGGIASGIAFRSFFDLGVAFTALLAFTAVILFIVGRVYTRSVVILVSIALFSVAGGMVRFDLAEGQGVNPHLETRVGTETIVRGVVIFEPDERSDHTNLTVSVRRLGEDNERQIENGRIRVVAPAYPEWQYGDVVRIYGELQKPDPFYTEESGRWFDYPGFLAKDGIRYTMLYPDIERIDSGAGNPIKGALFAFKDAFLTHVSRLIPEPHASLVGGVVVGAKQSLGEKLLTDFRETGIVHIVVLSGYNVTIVAETIRRVFAFLPFYISIGAGALSIVGFAIMTGAGATVVRASIMALLVMLARATGRTYMVIQALWVAALAMLVHNPYVLLHDVSFQLSFIATIGLIYVTPLAEQYLMFLPRGFGIREIATATIATQIFVLPLLLYHTGMLSLVSVPVNMLILVFVPVTMLFGFLTGVIGMISAVLAVPLAYITYLLLAYELGVVHMFADTSLTAFTIDAFPFWIVAVAYAGYAAFIVFAFRKMRMSHLSSAAYARY